MYNLQPIQRSKYFVLTQDILLPAFILLLLIFSYWFTLHSGYFTFEQVHCRLDYEPCPEGAVLSELAKVKGQNLLTFNPAALQTRLLAGDFTIREAEFRKKFPRTLIVELQSVYPVAAVQLLGLPNQWVIFDSRFRLIGSRGQDPNVPTVIVVSLPTLNLGEPLTDEALLRSLQAAIAISQEISQVRQLSVDGSTLTLQLQDGRVSLFSLDKDLQLQIRTLQAILADTTIKPEDRIIDVRFSQPILKAN